MIATTINHPLDNYCHLMFSSFCCRQISFKLWSIFIICILVYILFGEILKLKSLQKSSADWTVFIIILCRSQEHCRLVLIQYWSKRHLHLKQGNIKIYFCLINVVVKVNVATWQCLESTLWFQQWKPQLLSWFMVCIWKEATCTMLRQNNSFLTGWNEKPGIPISIHVVSRNTLMQMYWF